MDFAFRITFHGNCNEAIDYYAGVFRITPTQTKTFGDKRDVLGDVPDNKKRLIYEAVLYIPGTPGLRLIIGDTPALLFNENPGNFFAQQFIDVTDSDPDVIRGLYERFMKNAKANQELCEKPPYKLFGSLIDNAGGICWNLYCI